MAKVKTHSTVLSTLTTHGVGTYGDKCVTVSRWYYEKVFLGFSFFFKV